MNACEVCGLSPRNCTCWNRESLTSGAIDDGIAREIDRQFRNSVIDECIRAMNPFLRDMISRGQACDMLRALKRGGP